MTCAKNVIPLPTHQVVPKPTQHQGQVLWIGNWDSPIGDRLRRAISK